MASRCTRQPQSRLRVETNETHAGVQSVTPDDPWSRDSRIDPDTIMRQVRAEIARRRTAEVGLASPAPGSSMGLEGNGARWRPAAPRLPDKDQYVLADFLGFDDEDRSEEH